MAFSKLKDCLGKTKLPKRVKDAIVKEARSLMATKGGDELEVSQSAVRKFLEIVSSDRDAVMGALSSAETKKTDPVMSGEPKAATASPVIPTPNTSAKENASGAAWPWTGYASSSDGGFLSVDAGGTSRGEAIDKAVAEFERKWNRRRLDQSPKQPQPTTTENERTPVIRQRSERAETEDAQPTRSDREPERVQSGGRVGGDESRVGEGDGKQRDVAGRSEESAESGDRSGATSDRGERREDSAPVSGRDQSTVRRAKRDAGVTDYAIQPGELPTKFSAGTRYANNIAAIKLLREIEKENRPATDAEKAVLVKYVGWGGLKNAFVEGKTDEWGPRFAEVKSILTPDEYETARSSIRNAHYTSETIINGIYDAFRRFGFKGGKMVEGGAGLGHFWGLMPAAMRAKSSYLGVEMDSTTARIAKLLYPQATVMHSEFQKASLARDHFDASAGNPPFGSEVLFDKEHKEASKHSIHNYFIGKQIELLKPGGVGGWVVSHYFLDALDPSARKWIHEKAEFLGAIRLPNTAFKGNANTEVTTDIVFFRKRMEGETAESEVDKRWLTMDKLNDMPVNGWFAANPEMMLGKPSMEGTMHAGKLEFTLFPHEDRPLEDQLKKAVEKLPADVFAATITAETDRLTAPTAEIEQGVKVGSYYESGGKIMRRLPDVNGERQSVEFTPENALQAERIKGMAKLRGLLNALVRSELGDASPKALDSLRKALGNAYDAYTKKHGLLNSLANRRAFFEDTDASRVLALENEYNPGISSAVAKKRSTPENKVDAVKPSATKAAIFSRRVNVGQQEVTSAKTAEDALWVSMNQRGGVDVPYMAKLTGQTEEEVIKDAGDAIFQDPMGGWTLSEQYLTGNVREKLYQAQEAAKRDPSYQRNVTALEKAIPKDIAPQDIRANLGAGWIPADVVSTFATELMNGKAPDVVAYAAAVAKWNFQGSYGGSPQAVNVWGTTRFGFGEIMDSLLNGKAIRIYDKEKDAQVFNAEATVAAQAKADEVREKFSDWVMQDDARRERLHRIYNDTMNNYVDPHYSGAHLTLPGKSSLIDLRPHQKSVAARTIATRTALYDHVVGAGKTFAGIAAFMEMKRLGIVRKPMFAVPNHLTMQWRDDFVKLYPNANVLFATPKDFEKGNRKKLFARIMTGDYDAVIVGHSSLKKIGVPPETEIKMFKEMMAEITEAIEQMRLAEKGGKRDSRFVTQMEKTKESIKAKLERAQDRVGAKDDSTTFDELGIDGIFVDEAHEFKNLFYTTQMTRVAGMGNPEGSGRAFDLFVKLRYLRERFNGQAPIVFATGTPVSNSLVEMFTIQRYLMPDELRKMGLTTLDAWAKTFGDVRSVHEVDPSGTGYRMATRFAGFTNVGELSALYRTVADVVTMEDLKQQAIEGGGRFPVPNVKGGKPNNIVVKRTDAQHRYFGIETERTDSEGNAVVDAEGLPIVEYNPGSILHRIANMPKDPREDNMLKVTNDARKSSLDMRLIDPNAVDDEQSKPNEAVRQITRIWKDTSAKKGTQLVFCDLSVPASAKGKATKEAKALGEQTFIVTGSAGTQIVTDAKPVELPAAPDISFFIRKDGKEWVVSEKTTGKRVTGDPSKEMVVTKANKLVEQNLARLRELIESDAIPLEKVTQLREEYEAANAPKEEAVDESNELAAEEGEKKVSMDELLADSSSFSVYDDMKAKLIKAGVPEKEIAFIHDYDSPEKKRKLFAAVNAGDVRILFGSTGKMGAGTNVQRRAVALHHLDAPWRPSDLEQREGRVVRQGNLFFEEDPDGFEVEVNRYATGQTYDTRMWQLIEHKAGGIVQFRKADRSTREMMDVDGEAANAAEMKAAASGDPLIQKEIELRGAARKLELLKKSWQSSEWQMKSEMKYAEGADSRFAEDRKKWDVLAKVATNNPKPEKFAAETHEVGGKWKPTEDRGDLIEAIKLAAAMGASRNAPKTFARYRGLELQWKPGTDYSDIIVKSGGNEWEATTFYKSQGDISGIGLIQRIDNFLDSPAERIRALTESKDAANKKAAEIKKLIGKPFAKEAELEKAKKEHAETLALLKQGKKTRAAKPDIEPLGAPSTNENNRPESTNQRRAKRQDGELQPMGMADDAGRGENQTLGSPVDDAGAGAESTGDAGQDSARAARRRATPEQPGSESRSDAATEGVRPERSADDATLNEVSRDGTDSDQSTWENLAEDASREAHAEAEPLARRLGATIERVTPRDMEDKRLAGDGMWIAYDVEDHTIRYSLAQLPRNTPLDSIKDAFSEEIIHAAQGAVARSEAMGNSPLDGLTFRYKAIVAELSKTPTGREILKSSQQAYLSGANAAKPISLTEEEAVENAAYGIRWGMELERQLVQLRKSGRMTEESLRSAYQKLRAWFLRVLSVLKKAASNPGETSPLLEQSIRKVEAALAGESDPASLGAPTVQPDDSNTTSTKKAFQQKERAAEGREATSTLPRPKREALIDAARAKLNENPDAGKTLVREINDGPFTWEISDEQEALLAAYKREVRTEKKKQADIANDDSKTAAERSIAREKWDTLEAENEAIDHATNKTGSAWHRWGMFRMQELREDFSFENIERVRRAKLGRRLTAEESAELEAQAEIVKAAHEEEIKRLTELADTDRDKAVKTAIEKAKAEARRNLPDPRVLKHSQEFIDKLKGKAALALARVKAKLKPVRLGAPSVGEASRPEWFDDAAVVGASLMAESQITRAEWEAQMIEAMGEDIRSQMSDLWAASNATLEAEIATETGESEPGKRARLKRNATKDQLVEAMRESMKEDNGIDDLARYIKKLALVFIGDGIDTRDALMHALHQSVQDIDPALDREMVEDLFSDYGKFKPATTDSIKIKAAQLRGEVQQTRKLLDMARGVAAKLTGIGRVEPSDEYRRLTKEVEDAKRRGNFKVVDPERQVKNALEAIKKRLKNEIADMTFAIATRNPMPGRRNAVQYDEQTKALKEARLAKKAEYDAIFPKDVSKAKLDAVSRALDRSISAMEEQIRTGNLYPGKIPTKLTSPEIEAKRAQLVELRGEREVLRGLDSVKVEADKMTAVQKRIDELEAERAKGWPKADKATRPTVETAALAELKAKRAELLKLRQKDEVRQLEAWKASASRQLAQLNARIAKDDFAPRQKPADKVPDKELLAIQFKIAKAKETIALGHAEAERANRSMPKKALDTVADTFHTLRALMTGGEFSGVLRQGKLAALSHPILTAKAAGDMFKGFRSEAGEHAVMKELNERPNAPIYKKAKLAIHDPAEFTAAQLEGNYRSRWANKIPFISGSGRAYSTFLNKLRADIFDVLVQKLASRKGPPTMDEYETIAKYVNEMTGSGGLGVRGQKAAEALNVVFFAPKYVASRFQMLTGHSMWNANPATRRLIAEEYGRILIGAAIMYSLYAAFKEPKEKIETDPRSGKFGKIPAGNGTYIDPMAGLIQATVFLSRLASGKTVDSKGVERAIRTTEDGRPKFGSGNAFDLMARFARSKASPVAGSIIDRLNGEDFMGEPITVGGQLINLATPMTYNEIYETLKAQGLPKGMALSILAIFGEGLQTYQPKEKKPAPVAKLLDFTQ